MALIRFSTQDYACADRLEALQDIYASMAQSDIVVPRGEIPHIDVRIRLLPGVSVAHIECSTMSVARGRLQLADDNDDLVLLLNPGGLPGQGVSYHQGRDVLENPAGSGCVGFNNLPGRLAFTGQRARLLALIIPRAMLAAQVPNLEAMAKACLAPDEPMVFLQRLALSLTRTSHTLPPGEAVQAAEQLLDLVALALGATPEARIKAFNRGLSAARLNAIQADIKAHMDNGHLSLDWVSGRHGVSPRYVRALFERSGTSFTDYLLELRLQRAFQRLTTSADQRRSVVEIAYAAGFNNLSWFYRAFSRRFGMPPGEVKVNRAGLILPKQMQSA